MDYSFLKVIGNNVGDYISKGIAYLSNATPSKIVGILILLILAYFTFSLVKQAIKWLIVGLIVFLIVSLGASLL